MKTFRSSQQFIWQSQNLVHKRSHEAAASGDPDAGASEQAARPWAQPFNLGRITARGVCVLAARVKRKARTQKAVQWLNAEKGGTCLSAPL